MDFDQHLPNQDEFSTSEVAILFNVSTESVRNWYKAGRIPKTPIPRGQLLDAIQEDDELADRLRDQFLEDELERLRRENERLREERDRYQKQAEEQFSQVVQALENLSQKQEQELETVETIEGRTRPLPRRVIDAAKSLLPDFS